MKQRTSSRMSTLKQNNIATEEINDQREKFKNDTELVREEALMSQRNKGESSVPLPMLIVLGYFAFFKVIALMSNPWISYPLTFLGSAIFILYKLELLEVLLEDFVPKAKKTVNGLIAKTPIDFRI